MSWTPISGSPTQYQKSDGTLASDYYIKFYEAGTTTALSMATDSTGGTTLAKAKINSSGYPVNGSDAVFIPHVDQTYKIVLYKNATDADNDTTGNAEWVVDNVPQSVTSTVENASGITFTPAGTGATNTTVQAKLRERVSVLDRGADNTGTTSSQTAFDNCLGDSKTVVVPSGTYLVDGLNVTLNYQKIIFEGDVTLKANSNDGILFHQTSSWCHHEGTFSTNSNSKTGVWGMAVAPADLTQTTTVVENSQNVLPGIIGDNGLDECVVLQCGPDVGGTDSGCFYNKFPKIRSAGAKRGVWLKDPPNAGGSSCNRNEFYDFRAGTSSGTGSNTGIQIDAGDTNTFYGPDFEGVSNGTSPNTTPTGLVIANASAVNGAANNSNKFFGAKFEACTADVNNSNARSEFYGCTWADSKCTFTANPLIVIGGDDPSQVTQRSLGLVQTDAVTVNLGSITSFSDSGGAWQDYTINASRVEHVGSVALTSIGQEESKYWQIGGMVFWSFRFAFQAANNNDLLITLPVAPEVQHYQTNSTVSPMEFALWTNDGATSEWVVATLQSGSSQIRVGHSSAWDTSGVNNRVWCSVMIYHKA